MSDKLGFTFYPKDWWASDSFFDFTPEQRYIYLECLFIMYSNGGYMKTQKTQFENRIRLNVSDENWLEVTKKFVSDENGFTHISVNKRLRKAVANRENGKNGGRPPKNPKNPTLKPKQNPPSEIENESEKESKKEINNSSFAKQTFSDSQWCEAVMMRHKIEQEKIKDVIDRFEQHLILKGSQKSDLSEFKEHLSSWLPKTDLSEFTFSMPYTSQSNQRQPQYDD